MKIIKSVLFLLIDHSLFLFSRKKIRMKREIFRDTYLSIIYDNFIANIAEQKKNQRIKLNFTINYLSSF